LIFTHPLIDTKKDKDKSQITFSPSSQVEGENDKTRNSFSVSGK
jgi:hypothetical protein